MANGTTNSYNTMSLKTDKVLCYDLGIFPEQALRILRDVAELRYFVPWIEAFPSIDKITIGENFDGLERVEYFEKHKKWADWIFVPDTLCSELVEDLRTEGYPTAGVGLAEQLELKRWYAKQVQQKNKLPVQDTEKIVGCKKLREYLESHKEVYVKFDSIHRAVGESFKHYDWKQSEQTWYKWAWKFGPFREDIVFVCEEVLPGVEPGSDFITWDGQLLFPTMIGFERKGVGYIARTYQTEKEYPKPAKLIFDGIAPEFKKHKTKFFGSTEFLIDKDKIPFLLDNTERMAAPCTSAIQTELITNFTSVVKGLATGEKVLPVMEKKYSAGLAMESPEAEEDWVNISFPSEMRKWIKLRTACKHGKEYYAIPPLNSVCTVIAIGDSIKEVVDTVKERSKEVKAKRLENQMEDLDLIVKDIEQGRLYGINF